MTPEHRSLGKTLPGDVDLYPFGAIFPFLTFGACKELGIFLRTEG